jgi:heme-degrading monooxygenase HmoA
MAALVTISTPGMSTEGYDRIAGEATPSLKEAVGFRFHVAYPSGDSMVVMEVWDSAEQHMQWFEKFVLPHFPPGVEASHEVIELHNVLTP